MAEIIYENVKKLYGSVKAVENFCLEIKENEFVILIGPSGCGKSTVLRMTAGLEQISGGTLFMDGRAVNNIPAKNRDIAMVFQNYALYPHMSVYDNIAFGLKMRKVKKADIQNSVMEVARLLELTPYLKRKPLELSGGQRQRAALGRAMVRSPRAFLLDEPLSNLDAKLRIAMRREIVGLYQKLETTFIYVTHDQTEAMTMGSRIVVMDQGIIQQADTPQRIYDAPCNVFVARFIGSPPMNIMEGEIIAKDGEVGLRMMGTDFLLPSNLAEAVKQMGNGEENRVLAGIRPEHIFISNTAEKKDGVWGKVELVENMGYDSILYIALPQQKEPLSVRAFGFHGASEDTVFLQIHMDKICLFDKKTQRAIG